MSEPIITLPALPPESLPAATLAHLGYPGPEAVSERVRDHIDRETARCLALAEPRVICKTTPFKQCRQGIIEGEGLALRTPNWSRLTRMMTNVRYLCCLALTLGEAVDEAIREQGHHRITSSFILDSVASALAELLAEESQTQIHQYFADRGLTAGNRFSPGYCDWPMKSGQAELGAFLHPEIIGIQTVPATGLMMPRKSITAVIIAAAEMPDRTPCFLCVRECPHRRAPFDPDRKI